ncbi:hypothetical protein PENANT_c035G07795 [Penicillium antarcticum]|uniref:Uncharacterized protein n=1 Tax=Penicillium antarcticum TaxID=416450 RepID=A0A1V6PU25_9EURO|nr:uncharacterized protein N7508_009903 [Penicillium antarcticum]KAJ5295082.1 hypothetical protein N7508_009903 [Penicillium antarcticum]OQD80443.1 hypothetical protein PENANT_c035G07795 [Penicillium antarcticum]
MQEQPNHDLPNANGTATASTPKRKPPKLRPPKLRKGPTSEPESSNSNEQRVNGIPESAKSNSVSSIPESSSTGQMQEENQSPSPEPAPQVENPKERTRHHRRVRRVSTLAQDPSQDQDTQLEQRDNRSLEQRKVQETQVSNVLNPPEAQGQVQRAGELVPQAADGAVEQVRETTEVKPQSQKNDQLRLRLDLNLDVEVELKAKIRGDLTLQLLQ